MRCPKCGGAGGREWYQCPEYGGKPVCADCCRKCRHHDSDPRTVVTCRYGTARNMKRRDREMIRRLREMLGGEKMKQKIEDIVVGLIVAGIIVGSLLAVSAVEFAGIMAGL